MGQRLPVRFSGAIEHYFTVELFRAVFLPIRLHPSWSKWLIFGSFNSRTVLQPTSETREGRRVYRNSSIRTRSSRNVSVTAGTFLLYP